MFRSLVAMAVVIVGLHVVGWGTLGVTGVMGLGLGVTAYTLGMRHAFDADHVAAIDNVTRKLLADRPDHRPMSVGFWFALGHSTVVFVLCLLLALGVRSLGGQVQDESSTLQQTTGVIGLSVSTLFLVLIGVLNAVVLAGILKVVREMRSGHYDEARLEDHLRNRGLMNRILGRTTRAVSRPWHMYPVGVLFGLGFDTATEVSLLVLAAGAAASQLPWYAFLALPILFAAGMSLFDSLDGGFMAMAYGWASARPVRTIYYSLTMTALSVAVALLVGGVQVMDLLGLATVSLDRVGYLIVLMFAVTWAVAVTVWRLGRIEERWTASA